MTQVAGSTDRRWLMLGAVSLARVSTGFQFQSVAAIAPAILGDLQLTYAQLGLLIGLFSLPGIVISLPGGIAGQRTGARKAAMAGLFLMAIGAVVTAAASTFLIASLGRTVSGVGGIIVNLAFSRMIAAWFAGKELATAMGIMLAAWPIGMGLALLTLGPLAQDYSWRWSIAVSALAAMLAIVVILVIYRDPWRPTADAEPRGLPSPKLTNTELKAAVAAGITWTALNASLFVFVSFAPSVLIAHGYSVGRAGVLVSVALWVTLLSIPLGGYIADRTGFHHGMITGGALATAICMLAFIFVPGPIVWCVLAGVVVGAAPGPAMSLLPRIVAEERLSRALGVYYCVFYTGAAVTQPAAGLFRDVSGWAPAPLAFSAALMTMTIVGLLMFRAITHQATRDNNFVGDGVLIR
jgi:MFS family permease